MMEGWKEPSIERLSDGLAITGYDIADLDDERCG